MSFLAFKIIVLFVWPGLMLLIYGAVKRTSEREDRVIFAIHQWWMLLGLVALIYFVFAPFFRTIAGIFASSG